MDTQDSGPVEARRQDAAGHLVDFEQAEVITPMIYPPRPVLVVSGQKPYLEMEVTLVPLVYVSAPPYWGIQVVGTPSAEGLHPSQPITAIPYSVELDLAGVTGTKGIEVIGETVTKQIEVTTGPSPA